MSMGPEEFARQWVADHAPRNPVTEGGVVVAATDWCGNQFRVGQRVGYCIGAGHGQMMAFGEVLKIESEPRERGYFRDAEPGETPDRSLTSVHGVTYRSMRESIPYDDIRVQVLTLRTSGRWDNKTRSRPAWVNPRNITALPMVWSGDTP